jgi:pectate lyase
VSTTRNWRAAGLVAVGLLAITTLGACRQPPTPPPTTGGPTPTSPNPTVVPPTGGTQTVTATITVRANTTYDGQNKLFRGGGSLGSGGDGEGKEPLFKLEKNASIKNLTIGSPASDGIHCLGTCTITSVVWQDVLDDAATLKGTSASDVMTIEGGSAAKASDKVFQHNGPGTVHIKNFRVQDFGKLYRSCGNCSNNLTVFGQGGRHVIIENVTAVGPGKELAGINVNYRDSAEFRGVTISGSGASSIVPCGFYTGVTSGEPQKTNADNSKCTGTNTIRR